MLLKQAKDTLFSTHSYEILDIEETMLLHDINRSNNSECPGWEYKRFNFDILTNGECTAQFRFGKFDIKRLVTAVDVLVEICAFNWSKF